MKHLIVPIFMCFLLVLIGCSGDYAQGDPGKRNDDYKTGTGSLDMTFAKNTPPSQLRQLQTSTVALKLENDGATTIKDGFVTLSYDKSILRFTQRSSEYFSLRGKSLDYPKGEVTVSTFPFSTLALATESQTRDTAIIATSCFDYQTEVFEQICIDTDPYNTRAVTDEDICDLRDVSPGSSGAPLKVDDIQIQYISDGSFLIPQFVIEISHANILDETIYRVGEGSVFCSSTSFDSNDMNIVEFEATLSDVPLDCDQKGEFSLHEGRDTIICKGFPIDQTIGNYEAPFSITLDYGVSKSETQRVEIIR